MSSGIGPIQLKAGVKANIPTSGLAVREQLYTTDTHALYVADSATTVVPVVPAVEDLTAIGTIDVANDLLFIHDTSLVAGKKVTVADFKTALALVDAEVALISGGTPGYLGTDGTDGVLRGSASILMTPHSGNGYTTLSVGAIDLGTF
jgi:hypothetical protein